MKYLNFKKPFALLAIAAFSFSACKKIKTAEPMGDAGQTLVKMLGGGSPFAVIEDPINFVSTPFTLTKGVIDIRRDVPNNTELNRIMTVVVKDDLAAVAAADPTYIPMPAAWYTLTTSDNVAKVGGSGGTWTFSFKAGEFAKQIYINIPNATLLNPAAKYALGFTITSADAGGIITASKTVVVVIGAKNAYDGIWSYVSGFVQRYNGPGPTNPICCDGLTGPLGPTNPDVIFATVGANTVEIPPAGTAGTWTWSGGVSGVAGIDGFRITVDPVTNLVSESSSVNLTLTKWAGHTNSYSPGTKTFTMAWTWNPVTTTREYEVVMKYKGPR